MPVQLIGDLLASELAHMQPYVCFCSSQLNAAALLQTKTHNQPEFKDFLKVQMTNTQFTGSCFFFTISIFLIFSFLFEQKVATNYRCKGMPLSSFLLKPMQRLTRYPLLIKNVHASHPIYRHLSPFSFTSCGNLAPHCLLIAQILEHTPDGHEDREPLREALERAEELCSQVNEAVREKENADRLEWIQNHIQCEGPIEVNTHKRGRSLSSQGLKGTVS